MSKRTTPAGKGKPAIVTIDVAHPPLSSEEAERVLDEALRAASLSGGTRVIRIIHGYGSGGTGGILKTAVRNWAYRRREKIALALAGEEYSPFSTGVQKFLSETGLSPSTLGPADPGYTLIFISR